MLRRCYYCLASYRDEKKQKVEVDTASTVSKPAKVKCTLPDEKKIKIFTSDLMIQAYCLYTQKVKIES